MGLIIFASYCFAKVIEASFRLKGVAMLIHGHHLQLEPEDSNQEFEQALSAVWGASDVAAAEAVKRSALTSSPFFSADPFAAPGHAPGFPAPGELEALKRLLPPASLVTPSTALALVVTGGNSVATASVFPTLEVWPEEWLSMEGEQLYDMCVRAPRF